jgi:hypothetical protein
MLQAAIRGTTKSLDMIKLIIVSESWKKIFPDKKENKCLSFGEETLSTAELATTQKHMEHYENVNAKNNEQWFKLD